MSDSRKPWWRLDGAEFDVRASGIALALAKDAELRKGRYQRNIALYENIPLGAGSDYISGNRLLPSFADAESEQLLRQNLLLLVEQLRNL